jgi:predicted porin
VAHDDGFPLDVQPAPDVYAPKDVSYYAEARMRLGAGVFGALRASGIHFRDLSRSGGARDRWDYDVRRLQLGAGYRLSRATEVRAEYMINTTSGRDDPRDDLVSVRWGWAF